MRDGESGLCICEKVFFSPDQSSIKALKREKRGIRKGFKNKRKANVVKNFLFVFKPFPKGGSQKLLSGFCPLRGYPPPPPPPLTENHFAKKPLAERGGAPPPPSTENPQKCSKNMGQKG